ncbi:MAG: endo alpha-1,4 polygalactosaminidase [Thiomonas sp.]|uniref:bifunctional glycoside hydrolase 114/ polysaccharide deacetylase family protein n=1 Tax=Thiomonas sp. TaxID=2047785 RepID=UPI002A36F5A3|nr:endo alpha-1,4 polygalactosaminidase [Thiomonas sp.]MDY0328970.1 endo alpha-1,4 polygalactosaminidase [Thiomonas sp.]
MHRRQFLQSLAQSRLLTNPLGRTSLLGFGLLGAMAGPALAQSAPATFACTCGNCPDCLQGAADPTLPPAVAFYYGARIPVDDLRAFDWVVLEPQHALAQDKNMVQALGPHTLALAYVSVGEVTPERPYFADMPKAWLPASNAAWGSRVIDQTAAGWPPFLRERIVKPLWDAGFRAFFLDTLDSYQLLAKTPAAQQQQAQALAETLRSLVAAFPGIRLMLNRGFELVDATLAPSILAVTAESLYRGWNQGQSAYVEVKASDREWLLARFGEMRSRFNLPCVAIDYCAPQDRAAARQTAQQIAAHGLIPWVADPTLESLGVGTVELVPRRVLLLHSCEQGDSPELQAQSAHLYGAMPLEYLGLVPEYRYVGAPAITEPLAGRYAAIVLYPDDGKVPADIRALLKRAKKEGVPVAVLGYADFDVLTELGAKVGDGPLAAPIRVQRQPGTPNGEVIPLVSPEDSTAIAAGSGAQVWLRATGADGQVMDGAAITPWGGYALGPFGVFNLPGNAGTRWATPPIEFFRAALRVGADPMPDVATRTGRRVFFVHFDGDGWPNACDQPGSPLACEVLVREFLEKYQVPTLGSVIIGEISHEGLYPKLADQSQKWARRMYALPWVEVGSHTWSHPFNWVEASKTHSLGKPSKAYPYGFYLPLPNYTFSTRSNVVGAAEYIDQKLAPPGKKCNMILWPGDCNPPNEAVAMAYETGLGNINGGGAPISKSQPTLSNIWPMGIPKGRYFQVYAAQSNEEDFTHNWTGPYFGFERVIESYRMTDSPRRIKPIDLYYHPYIVTKAAGAKSLHTVYQWVLRQPTHAIFGHQYFRSVNDWRQATVARLLAGGWRLRSGAEMRQWTQPVGAPAPALERCRNLVGWNEHGQQRYLHASAGQAVLRSQTAGQPSAPSQPRLIEANADVTRWAVQNDRSVQISLQGHLPVEALFDLPSGWRVQAAQGARVEQAAAGVRVSSSGATVDLTLKRA